MNKGSAMYKNILVLSLIITVSCTLRGQNLTGKDANVLYRNEESFSAYIHSAIGIGIAYRRGIQVNRDTKKMLEVEMSNFKHPKEIKVSSKYNSSGSSKGYFLGKLNSLLLIRSGVGYKNILYRKSEKTNVEIRYLTFIGATVAFTKPIYLEIITNTISSTTVSTERYDPNLHNKGNIYGKSGFFSGFGKTKLVPAGYVKFGLSFDFANRYDEIKSIETGIIMDAYPIAIDIMAFNKNRNLLFSVFVKMIWGKKWL